MRTTTDREARERWIGRAMQEGASYPQAREILRHAATLHRLAEEECGNSGPYSSWCRKECEDCGGSHVRIYPHTSAPYWRHGERCTLDRTRFAEKRARERVAVIAAMFGAVVQFQGDPRGAVVKVCWPSYQRHYGTPPHDGGSGWEGVPS